MEGMLQRSSSGELYTVLELERDCTTSQVSQQYRRLALRYHPDRNAGSTVELFQRIEEAHRILCDPQQRQLYDSVGRDGLKHLGEYSGGMMGSLLLAFGNVAAGFLVAGVLDGALFISLLIGCYKIDDPHHWPSWGVVLIPVWCMLPVLLVAGLSVMIAAVRQRLFVLLLPSLRLLLCVVIAATTAAALDNRIPATSAFIPWIVWYVLGTLSDLVMVIPTVYRRTHARHFSASNSDAAAAAAAASAAASTGAGMASSAGTAAAEAFFPRPDRTSSGNNGDGAAGDTDGGNTSFVNSPLKTRRYWREVAEIVWEAVCVYTFMALATQRALSRTAEENSSSSTMTSSEDGHRKETVLSFWAVMAPLLAYFALHLTVNVYEGCRAESSEEEDADSGIDLNGSTPASTSPLTGEGLPTSRSSGSQSRHRPRRFSCGERVSAVLLRAFLPACGFYMTAMWAAKAEYEVNGNTAGADPSAFLAFLPILILLGSLAFCVCCGGCAVLCLGRAISGADRGEGVAGASSGAPPQQRGGSDNTRTSPIHSREEGYSSTGTRTPNMAGSATNSSGSGGLSSRTGGRAVRTGSAKEVTIENID